MGKAHKSTSPYSYYDSVPVMVVEWSEPLNDFISCAYDDVANAWAHYDERKNNAQHIAILNFGVPLADNRR